MPQSTEATEPANNSLAYVLSRCNRCGSKQQSASFASSKARECCRLSARKDVPLQKLISVPCLMWSAWHDMTWNLSRGVEMGYRYFKPRQMLLSSATFDMHLQMKNSPFTKTNASAISGWVTTSAVNEFISTMPASATHLLKMRGWPFEIFLCSM